MIIWLYDVFQGLTNTNVHSTQQWGLWLGLHGSFCEETATKNINNLPDLINKTGIEPEK